VLVYEVLGKVGSLVPVHDAPGTKHFVFGNEGKFKGTIMEIGLFASLANSHIHQSCHSSIVLVRRPQDAPAGNMPMVHGHTHALPDDADPRFVAVSVDKTGWGPFTLDEIWRHFEQAGRFAVITAGIRLRSATEQR
jgi:calcineurin-like phosphoesterase family protein